MIDVSDDRYVAYIQIRHDSVFPFLRVIKDTARKAVAEPGVVGTTASARLWPKAPLLSPKTTARWARNSSEPRRTKKRYCPGNGTNNKAKRPIAARCTEKTQSQRCTWGKKAPEWRAGRSKPSVLHYFGAIYLTRLKKLFQFNGLRVNANGMHFAVVWFGAWCYAALSQKLTTRS